MGTGEKAKRGVYMGNSDHFGRNWLGRCANWGLGHALITINKINSVYYKTD